MADTQSIHAIGRRKEAVCRVFLKPGSGKWDVNGRTLGDYFPRAAHVNAIQQASSRPTRSTLRSARTWRRRVNGAGGALRFRGRLSAGEDRRAYGASCATWPRATRERSSARNRRPKACGSSFEALEADSGRLDQDSNSSHGRLSGGRVSASRSIRDEGVRRQNHTEVRFAWQIKGS
jgi:hypothetical protein